MSDHLSLSSYRKHKKSLLVVVYSYSTVYLKEILIELLLFRLLINGD